MIDHVNIKDPGMVQFLAEKMVERGEDTMFSAMLKIVWAIWWTHEKKYCSLRLDPIEPPHAEIISRSLAVSLKPPVVSELGAWVHMISTCGVDAKAFADMEHVAYWRNALNRSTVLDV